MNKAILPILLVAAVLGFGLFIIISNKQSSQAESKSGKTYSMILGENGYEPQNITIKKGDIIQFNTSLDKPFWPASNIHPTHGIYPEFDSQDAIAAGESCSFKFEKTGTWRYHDHLAPYFTGRIIVE